ncbi:MAG: hypothetical protein ACLVKO_11960 [Dysgonomonas sp.]
MKIAFTICSNNYLSQAKTLADSFFKYNDEYKFIIGLCDKKNELIDYSIFSPCEIVEVEELCIENFEWMVYNYNIIELNTATKPYYFQYFLKTYQDIDYIFYLDPDIQVFNSFSILEKELENKDILLTPHITTPLPNDKKVPNENLFLNYGIFNLGFLGLRKSTESEKNAGMVGR